MCYSTAAAFLLGAFTARAEEPKPVFTLAHKSGVSTVAFSPDGKTVAAAAGFVGVLAWDARTGKRAMTIEGSESFLAFSPDGKTLATTRNWKQGKPGAVVTLFDLAPLKERQRLEGDDKLIRCVSFSPDGTLLAGHSQHGHVRVWELATGKEVLRIPTNTAGHVIAFSPDGKHIAYDLEYDIRLTEVKTGKDVRTFRGHQQVNFPDRTTSGYLNDLVFSADGKKMATASCDNTARVWDVATGKALLVLEGHKGFVNAVAFFPDGQRLATGGEDGTVRIWDMARGRQLAELAAHGGDPQSENDTRKDVLTLAFSPDGSKLATGGGRDRLVKVWDTAALVGPRR